MDTDHRIPLIDIFFTQDGGSILVRLPRPVDVFIDRGLAEGRRKGNPTGEERSKRFFNLTFYLFLGVSSQVMAILKISESPGLQDGRKLEGLLEANPKYHLSDILLEIPTEE